MHIDKIFFFGDISFLKYRFMGLYFQKEYPKLLRNNNLLKSEIISSIYLGVFIENERNTFYKIPKIW